MENEKTYLFEESKKPLLFLGMLNVNGSVKRKLLTTMLRMRFIDGVNPFERNGKKKLEKEMETSNVYLNTLIARARKEHSIMFTKVGKGFRFSSFVEDFMKHDSIKFKFNGE